VQADSVLVTGSEGLCRWRKDQGRLVLSGGQFIHDDHVALLADGDTVLLGLAHTGLAADCNGL
jgi:hypothetical protein